MLTKLKNFVKNNVSDIFVILVVILVALISFGIGRLTVPKTEPIQIKNLEKASVEDLEIKEKTKEAQEEIQGENKGMVVGSKNSDKYNTTYE